MKFILDIATILGGIAAIWFFWERIADYRYRLSSSSSKKVNRQWKNNLLTIDLDQWRYWGAIFGAIFGGLGFLLVEEINVLGVLASFIITAIAIYVSTPDSLGRLVNPDSRDKIIAAIGLGIASSIYTSIIGVIVLSILGQIGGIWAAVLGALLGAVYGFFSLNIEKPYML